MSSVELYDRDFHEWIVKNAELLRSGRAVEADLNHIAEELEDMGKRERRALLSRLSLLIMHLLKWQAQPERRSRSWEATIKVQRVELKKLLAEMPSLHALLAERLSEAYEEGVLLASAETDMPEDVFLAASPFTIEQVLDVRFLP